MSPYQAQKHAGDERYSGITIKTAHELKRMRTAGQLAAQTLLMIGEYIRSGITTDELDQVCHRYMIDELDCIPAPLNYRGFPKSICTSVNHQVCHGIPGDRRLKNGDIVNIDVTVIKDGYHGDSSRMFYVGKPSMQARRLVETTYEAMRLGIMLIRPGICLGDVGHAIQKHAESRRYSVVRDYCGHGIGTEFHESPSVLHYGKPGTGLRLLSGMTLTVEPMINAGSYTVKLLPDRWTVVTCDHSLSAQWEHTVAVTGNGHEILTLRSDESVDWSLGDAVPTAA